MAKRSERILEKNERTRRKEDIWKGINEGDYVFVTYTIGRDEREI